MFPCLPPPFFLSQGKVRGVFCAGVTLLPHLSKWKSLTIIKGCRDEQFVTTTCLTPAEGKSRQQLKLRVTAANTEEDMVSIKATAMVITLLTFCLLATNTSAGMYSAVLGFVFRVSLHLFPFFFQFGLMLHCKSDPTDVFFLYCSLSFQIRSFFSLLFHSVS